jgi:hypothetical protein
MVEKTAKLQFTVTTPMFAIFMAMILLDERIPELEKF